MRKRKHVHHRFKVQRRVEIRARDRSNKSFLFAEHWRTVAEADHLPAAERIFDGVRYDRPHDRFRVAEVWPEDTTPRVVIPPPPLRVGRIAVAAARSRGRK